MITRQVTIVTGAGASIPYGFESGPDLTKSIWQLLRSTNTRGENLRAALTRMFQADSATRCDLQELSRRLEQGVVPSIDAFVQPTCNRHFIPAAKAAVAWRIAECENDRKCGYQRKVKFDDNWLPYLFRHMLEGITNPVQLEKNRVRIVTFNFDRVVEWHWYNALVNQFGPDGCDIERAFRSLPIVHVHGSLYDASNVKALLDVPMGAAPIDDARLEQAVKRINFVGDRTGPQEAAEHYVAEAEVLCFLGLYYAPLNLKKLGLPRHTKDGWQPSVVGTVFGMEDGEQVGAKRALFGATYEPSDIYTAFMPERSLMLLKKTSAIHL